MEMVKFKEKAPSSGCYWKSSWRLWEDRALLERKSFYLSYRWQSLLMAEGPQKTCLSLDQNHSSKSLPRRLPVRKDVDFSSCSSWVPDHGLTSCVWHLCLEALWHVGSSQTGGQTPVPCIAWRVLNHWTTRETPDISNYKALFSTAAFFHLKDNPLQSDGNSTLFIREYTHMVSHAR